MLEEGNTEGAEEQKQRIEQLQRERRKVLQDNNMTHQPRFFKYVLFFLRIHAFCVRSAPVFACVFRVTGSLHMIRDHPHGSAGSQRGL